MAGLSRDGTAKGALRLREAQLTPQQAAVVVQRVRPVRSAGEHRTAGAHPDPSVLLITERLVGVSRVQVQAEPVL